MGNQQGSTGSGGGEDSLLQLRQNLIHTQDSIYVRDKIKQLVNIGKLTTTSLRSETTISVLKHLARVHGLPNTFQEILLNLLQENNEEKTGKEGNTLPPITTSYKFKIFLTIKYAVFHDHQFIPLQRLLSLLLEEFPPDVQYQNKDFFKGESITQLMLAIITLLNPDRIATERIEEGSLWKLENYLPFITGNHKGEVKRHLEKMGYWSGNAGQHGFRRKGAAHHHLVQSGDEIIRSVQKKKGINVSAHVVKTQQTEAITTEENVSEKTQMSNISLSNALNEGRNRTVAASRAKETLQAPKSTTGSDRCWYKTTSTEINNFLTKARGGGAISPDDVDYLKNKLSGYKFSFSQSTNQMIIMIAEIFYLISKYQKLTTETIINLLDILLSKDHNGSRFVEARMHVLQATDRHCNRVGQVPEKIQRKLANFRDNPKGCNKKMKGIIWDILSTDDNFVSDNIRQAILKLASLEDCESGLNYLQRQISLKGRALELKEFPEFVSKLLEAAQGKFSESEKIDENEEEEVDIFTRSLQWSEMNWIETIGYPVNLQAAGMYKIMTGLGVINKLKWKTEGPKDDADEPDPAKISAKALEVLEDFIQIEWTDALEPKEIEILIYLGVAMNSSEDIKGKTVRCILRSFEKGLKSPDWNYFDKFSSDQLKSHFSFLLSFTTTTGIKDKRLQIFTLILLANILDVPSLQEIAQLVTAHLPFFRKQLQRNDIILPGEVKVVVEEELDKDFFFVEPPPEEYELVSTYVAKILLRLVEQQPTSCDELTTSVISQVLLSSHSKMTKILLSELLFNLAKSPEVTLSISVLNGIQALCFSPIADVHVYITSAYCTALANQSVSLDPEQVNFLVNLYSFKKVCLDKTDFSLWINPKILQTFYRACQIKLKLSEQVFHLMALILNNTCADTEDSPDYPIVKILLETVTISCKNDANQLPSSMIEAIESLLLESDVFDETCAGIVEQCMMAGRWVADSVIEEFTKYLWHEPMVSIPFLRRLAIANENQELPDSIFEAFQMELIGLRLHPDVVPGGSDLLKQINLDGGDPQELFRCLSKYISRGKLVSPLNLQVFSVLLGNWKRGNGRLELITNLSWILANGQSLPKEIIDGALFQSGDYSSLLEFSEAVVRRGQQLPETFLLRVCKEMENTDGKKTLNLVKTMIQYNHPIPPETVEAYLNQLFQLSTSKLGLSPDILSSVIHLLENNSFGGQANLDKIKDILINAVESQNAALVETGKRGLKLLPKEMLGEGQEEELGLKGISVGAAALIAKFLARRRRPLSKQLLQFIEDGQRRPSVKWTSKRRDNLEGELATDPKLIEKVGKLLREKEGHLNDFEVAIIESLFFTIANNNRSLSSEVIITSCQKSLEEIIDQRQYSPNKTCLNFLAAAGEVQVKWFETLKNEQNEGLVVLERWKQKPSSNKRRAALGKILEDFKFCTKYHENIIKALLSISKSEWRKLPHVANAVASSILQPDSSSFPSPEVVELIEREILDGKGKISEKVIEAFEKILQKVNSSNLKINVQPSLVALVDYFRESEKNLNSLEIIQFFSLFKKASENLQTLPSNLINILVKSISNENPLIRGKSLETLLSLRERKTAQWMEELEEKEWSPIYKITMENFYTEADANDDDKLEEKLDLEDSTSLNLFYVIHTLKYCELGGLSSRPKDLWAQHLLLSDTILSLTNSIDEQLKLYPIASTFCSLVSPGERLEILESIKDYQKQTYPNLLSPSRLITFINSAITSSNEEKSIMINCGNAKWLTSLIFKEIGKILCQKSNGLSGQISKMMLEESCTSIPVDILDMIVSKLEKGSFAIRQFQKFLNFVTENKGQMSLIRSYLKEHLEDVVSLQQLESSLQAKVLMSHLPKVNISSPWLSPRLEKEIGILLTKNYEYSSFLSLITKIRKLPSALEILENIFYQMEAYSVSSDRFSQIVFTLLEQKKTAEWIEISNRLIMEHLYSGCQGVKSASSIGQEFCQLNNFTQDPTETPKFSQNVKKVQEGLFTSQNCSSLSHKLISNWSVEDISSWAHSIKFSEKAANLNDEVLTEILAVVSRACVLLRNYRLTAIQILSICSGISNTGKGHLLQVATGSGKSTIIVAIAVVKCLQNLSVDIYTSSPVLAERDAKEWAPFYKLFGLSCDHNGDKGSGYIRGEKNAYRQNIVYGDTSQFQFDALRDEYSGLNTRAGREYGKSFAIVDEVDSMLVDDSSKLARLSSTLPGMDLLQILYHFIWQRLFDVQHRLYAVGEDTFYLEGARSIDKNGNMRYTYQLPDGSEKCIENLPMYILHHKDEKDASELEKAFIFKVKEIDNFVSDHLKRYVRALIGDEKFSDGGRLIQKLPLPKPLIKFAQTQVNNWIDSAMTAVTFQENVHYVVDQDQIKPVDFHTTGIIQSSTNWNNGLHQFLQIKHNLKVTTETVTTNFLSNMAMLQKYGKDLIGFTGTLGSDFGQKVLKEVYDVETVIIPELYYKLFQQLPDQIAPTEKEWTSKVVHSALHESAKNRAVLVICQTIKQAELIADKLGKEGNGKVSVKIYTRNDQNQEKQVEQVNPGDIIVATNLAGRGTDIKTAKVEKFGGLHVILTFLPDSLRVEDQAFGRTARQGHKGSGQLILVSAESPEILKRRRDMHERFLLSNFKETELITIQTKDKLFSRFCKVYSRIRGELLNNIIEFFGYDSLTVFEQTILQAIEQQWAIFLKRIDDGEISAKDATEEYENFEIMIEQDYKNNCSIAKTESCFYWIQCGNQHLKKKYNKEAMEHFDKAIAMDSDFSGGAHAGKGFVLLRSLSPKDTYKTEALSHFHNSLKILYTEIGLYSTAQTLVQHRGGRIDSELFKQLTEKINLIGEYCRNVEGNMSSICKSLRRVYLTESFAGEVEATWQVDDVKPEVISKYDSKSSKFSLEFHDLTHFIDADLRDAAIGGLKSATNFISKKVFRKDEEIFDTSEDWDKALQCQAIDAIVACENVCENFAIQVENQNLQELCKLVEKHSKSLPILQLNGVNSWAGVRKLVSAMKPKSFTLIIAGDKQFAIKLSKLAMMTEKSFKVNYEDEDQLIYRKTLNYGFDEKEIPEKAQLRIEIEFEKANEMGDIKTLILEPEMSIILKDVQKETVDLNWETTMKVEEEGKSEEKTVPGLLQGFNENIVTFRGLETSKLKSVIRCLRHNNVNILLRMESLTYSDAEECLKEAVRKQEEMTENEMKEMGQQFSTDYIPLETIRELIQRGILLMPVFGEKAFIPWRSIISVGILASVQVAAGAVLVCTGFGATVGMGLITEGMSDYVTAYRAYSTRQFDWKAYAIQKAVSLTISCVSMGLGSLKDGAKGAASLGQAAATEVAEQAGVKMATGVANRTLNESIKVAFNNLKSVVVKHVAVQGVETAARTGVNVILESVADFAFESAKEHIILEVDNTVKREFRKPEFCAALATYSAMDLARRNKLLDTKVNGWLTEVTNPQSNNWNQAWDQVGYPLCQGILSDPKYLGSTFSMTTRLIGLINGSKEILTVVSNVTENIEGKLKNEVKSFTPSYAIQEHFGLSSSDADKITVLLQLENGNGTFHVKKFPNETDLETCKLENVELEQLQNLFKALHETESKFTMDKNFEMSKLMKTVVDHLAKHIIHVANRQLVSPITTLAVGKLVASISEQIQSNYLVSDAQMSEDQLKVKMLKEKDPNELSSDDKKFLMENDRPITFAEQIRGNAKDYTVAYQKRDIIANIMTMTEEQKTNRTVPDKFTKEADKTIDSMLNGGPADMTTVFLLAQLNGADVKMVDDPNYVPTDEDKAAGVQIIVWEKPAPGEKVGHYVLKDTTTGEVTDFSDSGGGGGNDCAYNVLKHITGKSVDELRLQGVVFVACNQEKFGEINKSAEWIRERYPQEANNLLHVGGKGGGNKNRAPQGPRSDINPDLKLVDKQPENKEESLTDKDGNEQKTLREWVERSGKNKQYELTNKLTKCAEDVLKEWANSKCHVPAADQKTIVEGTKNGVRLDLQGTDSDKGKGEFLNFQMQMNGIDRKGNKGNSTSCAEVHVHVDLVPMLQQHPERFTNYFRESITKGHAVYVGKL